MKGERGAGGAEITLAVTIQHQQPITGRMCPLSQLFDTE
ncbi:hypothetical protein MNBD_GAMMA26-1125 [hydrothermal vent metagenome]|uniref:Uncharacterized protein n=1 Tax=hydrothermal vent metagenome TaxID=652676 RepID=A0A3B1B0J9_9ZZZZ